MAVFERDELIRFDDVPCEFGLLGKNLVELPLPRQPSAISWAAEWSVRILEPRTFELTGKELEAWYVATYGNGEVMFVLPIVGRPVYTGNLTVA